MGKIPKSKINVIKRLYYDKGYNMKDIAEKFDVSYKTVLCFMKSNDLKRRSFKEANKNSFEHKPLSFKFKINLKDKDRELLIKAIMIYWCEGSKGFKSNTVDLANCDPEMLKLFILFLRKICRVDESRIRIYLYCYSNQNIDKNIEYWSNMLNVPANQFTKPYVRTDFQESKVDKMPHGMIHIRYADKKLLYLIKELIKKYSK